MSDMCFLCYTQGKQESDCRNNARKSTQYASLLNDFVASVIATKLRQPGAGYKSWAQFKDAEGGIQNHIHLSADPRTVHALQQSWELEQLPLEKCFLSESVSASRWVREHEHIVD